VQQTYRAFREFASNKKVRTIFWIVAAITFVHAYRVGSVNGTAWDGLPSDDVQVSVFSSDDSVKNYRLGAYVDAEEYAFFFKKGYVVYAIKRAEWPNGGELVFNGCYVYSYDMTTTCNDQDGKAWKVDLTSPPQKPETDTSYDLDY